MRPYNINGGRPSLLSEDQRKYIKDNLRNKSLRTLGKELGVSYSCVYYSLKKKTNDQKRFI